MNGTLKHAIYVLTLAVVCYAAFANNTDENETNNDWQKRVEDLELELRQVKKLLESRLSQDECPCDLAPLSK